MILEDDYLKFSLMGIIVFIGSFYRKWKIEKK